MKTATKKGKILTDADFDGPMMIYNPMTKKQEKELGEWVANRKAKIKTKQLKKKGIAKIPYRFIIYPLHFAGFFFTATCNPPIEKASHR